MLFDMEGRLITKPIKANKCFDELIVENIKYIKHLGFKFTGNTKNSTLNWNLLK